ncbi:MAG: hypothetical protein JSW40_07780 [Candidatus Omnitrophota bacterium]|nr:MAG: hypothetical protein JSW40_07780 [Candidatus Omnitrophota bacterium]
MKKKKKKSFEIRFYEDLTKGNPRFIQALWCLGDAYTRDGFYEEGLEVDRKLVRLKPEDPVVHYNLACSLSLVGHIGQALEALKRAVLLGYSDFSYILKDPDLESVRNHPHFKGFFARIKRLKL